MRAVLSLRLSGLLAGGLRRSLWASGRKDRGLCVFAAAGSSHGRLGAASFRRLLRTSLLWFLLRSFRCRLLLWFLRGRATGERFERLGGLVLTRHRAIRALRRRRAVARCPRGSLRSRAALRAAWRCRLFRWPSAAVIRLGSRRAVAAFFGRWLAHCFLLRIDCVRPAPQSISWAQSAPSFRVEAGNRGKAGAT